MAKLSEPLHKYEKVAIWSVKVWFDCVSSSDLNAS